MENPTHAFKEIKLVFRLILESQTYSKTVMMSWSSRKKKKSAFFLIFFCLKEIFLTFVFILMYSVLNTLSLYLYI